MPWSYRIRDLHTAVKMANKERQIRHIKDVFPGADTDDDYKNELPETAIHKENVDPDRNSGGVSWKSVNMD